jgi:O-methyltransferase involved in polyketide biosynthesis
MSTPSTAAASAEDPAHSTRSSGSASPSSFRPIRSSPSAPTQHRQVGVLHDLGNRNVAGTGPLPHTPQLSAPGSQLAFEHRTPADTHLLDQARAIPALAQVTSLWKGGLGEDAPDWLARHGWQARSHDRAAMAAAYGRAVTSPSIGSFLTAIRRRTTDQ